MSGHNRYARYERGSPFADYLARSGEAVAIIVICLVGTLLGLAIAFARASKVPEPVKHTQPVPVQPELGGPPTKSVAARFNDACRALEAARERGDTETVKNLESELKELEREHYEKRICVLTDEDLRRADEQTESFKKQITDERHRGR